MKTVLIVEDDLSTQRLLKTVLGQRYGICAAVDAEDFFRMLREREIDLILMDISLPGAESGLELIRYVRTSPASSGIPVIGLSALAMPEDEESAYKAGCSLYMTKPFEVQELLRSVGQLLGDTETPPAG